MHEPVAELVPRVQQLQHALRQTRLHLLLVRLPLLPLLRIFGPCRFAGGLREHAGDRAVLLRRGLLRGLIPPLLRGLLRRPSIWFGFTTEWADIELPPLPQWLPRALREDCD